MSLQRIVHAESLDSLAPDDPLAVGSRRDLRWLHRLMGSRSILVRSLRAMTAMRWPARRTRVLEIGAGDGSLLLGVARAKLPFLHRVDLTVLDRQPLLTDDTVGRYAACGWAVTPQVADVHDWAAAPAAPDGRWDLVVANLFVHHFDGPPLSALLTAIGSHADRFLACEPRRSHVALMGSRLVGVIGANEVTREDAVLSVHAGFRADELSALWPARGHEWQLRERPAGLFSHCFSAERMGGG